MVSLVKKYQDKVYYVAMGGFSIPLNPQSTELWHPGVLWQTSSSEEDQEEGRETPKAPKQGEKGSTETTSSEKTP